MRHADTKVGVTLAFVGATGTMLYNLVKSLEDWGWLLGATAITCCIALFLAAGAALMALFPRTRPHNPTQDSAAVKKGASSDGEEEGGPADKEAVNLLFYGYISRTYRDKRPKFVDVFRALTSDNDRLTGQIAHQIHVNAHIATTKFYWANWAITAEAVAVGVLAIVAFIVGK